MDVVHPRCCGLDVHKKTVVACVLGLEPNGRTAKQVRTFGTMTDHLLALADWLAAEQVTHVAVEATGGYWKPLWKLLEDRFALLLVNARHIKAVPGRKTDVCDAKWLAELLRHGLLRPSFVPDPAQRELRELTRYRTTLVGERAAEAARLQKVLEGANRKLGDVASNVLGVSARQLLEQLIAGTTDPAVLAQLARGRLRAKIPQLQRALTGRMQAHQRFLLAQQLAHRDYLDEAIDHVSAEIATRVRPFEAAIQRLDTIPGIGRRTAEVLVAELGTDMGRFPTAAHLASWAGMCPGNDESAGNAAAARPGRAAPGCAKPWSRPPRPPGGPRRPTLPPSTDGFKRDGQEEGCRRGRPHHPGHRLSSAGPRAGLPAPRRRLLRPPRPGCGPATLGAAPGGPRRCRPAQAPRRLILTRCGQGPRSFSDQN